MASAGIRTGAFTITKRRPSNTNSKTNIHEIVIEIEIAIVTMTVIVSVTAIGNAAGTVHRVVVVPTIVHRRRRPVGMPHRAIANVPIDPAMKNDSNGE